MAPEYENKELTINPTQVFSVYNLTLKPSQPEEPPFTDHMKAIGNLVVHVDSKAPKPSSQLRSSSKAKSLELQLGSKAKDFQNTHLTSTHVVAEMHNEAQQAAGGLTSLKAISEEEAHLQLSSGMSSFILDNKISLTKDDPKVDFTFDEIAFTTNNEVAIIYPSKPNQEYFMVVSDFIFKCCLKEAFTKDPTQYKEYLSRVRGEIGITTFRNALKAHYLPHSTIYQENPKESHLTVVKRIFRYLKGTPSLGLWYPKCLGFDLKGYSDSDYAGCNMDRKSTSGACQLLGGKLVCWSAKKQQCVAMSLAEDEYVVAARCCANILWMKGQLTDYDIIYEKVPIFFDNTDAITISNNLVLYLRTKHIDIKFHFIRDHVLKGDIELHFIPIQYQLADIFTKPLEESTFKRLNVKLGMLNIYSKPEASAPPEEIEASALSSKTEQTLMLNVSLVFASNF
nr:copia protein [Tanacetum cinerariifolium]